MDTLLEVNDALFKLKCSQNKIRLISLNKGIENQMLDFNGSIISYEKNGRYILIKYYDDKFKVKTSIIDVFDTLKPFVKCEFYCRKNDKYFLGDNNQIILLSNDRNFYQINLQGRKKSIRAMTPKEYSIYKKTKLCSKMVHNSEIILFNKEINSFFFINIFNKNQKNKIQLNWSEVVKEWGIQNNRLIIVSNKTVYIYDFIHSKPQLLQKFELTDVASICSTSKGILIVQKFGFDDKVLLLKYDGNIKKIFQDHCSILNIFEIKDNLILETSSLYCGYKVLSFDLNKKIINKTLFKRDVIKDVPNITTMYTERKHIPLIYFEGFGDAYLPLIVYIHGGPHTSVKYENNILFKNLLKFGYNILAINYQGSTGFGVERYRQKDDDALKEVRNIINSINKDKEIILIGASYGGYICWQLLKRNCKKIVGAFILSAPLCKESLKIGGNFVNLFSNENSELACSRVKIPVKIVCGDSDPYVDNNINYKYINNMRKPNITYETIKGADHKHIWMCNSVQKSLKFFLQSNSYKDLNPSDEIMLKPYILLKINDKDANIELINTATAHVIVYKLNNEIVKLLEFLKDKRKIKAVVAKFSHGENSKANILNVLTNLQHKNLLIINSNKSTIAKVKYFESHDIISSNNFLTLARKLKNNNSTNIELYTKELEEKRIKNKNFNTYSKSKQFDALSSLILTNLKYSNIEFQIVSKKIQELIDLDNLDWLRIYLNGNIKNKVIIEGENFLNRILKTGGLILFPHYGPYHTAFASLKKRGYQFDILGKVAGKGEIDSLNIWSSEIGSIIDADSKNSIWELLEKVKHHKAVAIAGDFSTKIPIKRYRRTLSFMGNKYIYSSRLEDMIKKLSIAYVSMFTRIYNDQLIISFKEGTFNYQKDFYNNLEQLIFSAPDQWVGASEYRKLIISNDLK